MLEEEKFDESQSFLTHINEQILPRALMMGVGYDLFWTLNPKSLTPFVKAFSIEFEMRQKYDDWLAWQSGIYVRMAIVSSLGKEVKYPELPMSHEVVKRKSTENVNPIKEHMLERMAKLNRRFRKEELIREQ